jgi:Ion channel
MLSVFLHACLLAALTAWIHAVGIAVLVSRWSRIRAITSTDLFSVSRMLMHALGWLALLHLAEIALWALFYWWRGCLPNLEAALYFSGVTYTTVGYGDIVLAKPWRLIAPVEGLTGVLMCGLSTGYFFVVVSRIHQLQHATATTASAKEKK